MSITIIDTRRTRKPPPGPDAGASTGAGAARPHAVDVLVIDEDFEASYSLWALLRGQPGVRVAAAGRTEALTAIRAKRPAVVLLAAGLGPRFAFGITQLPGAPKVLIHANRRDSDLVGVAVLTGAAGSVWRYDDPDELADTIRLTAAGAPPRELAADVIQCLVERVDDPDRSIASLLLHRAPIDEIARVLGISASRVRARQAEIVKRLDASVR